MGAEVLNLNICISINISGLLNIWASISPTSPSPKPLAAIIQRHYKKTLMKNIDKINPFKSTIKKTEFGTLTKLVTAVGVSENGSISFGEKTLLANYVYKKGETYNLVYTIVDTDGNTESFIEDDGILPTLFLSPSQESYVSVVPYHPDKELEISIPVFNRENTELPKGNRPFVGDFIGTSNQFNWT